MPLPVKKTKKKKKEKKSKFSYTCVAIILSKIPFLAIIFLHANVQWVYICRHNIKKTLVRTKTVVGVDRTINALPSLYTKAIQNYKGE